MNAQVAETNTLNPSVIDEARFNEMFNMMPPARWQYGGDNHIFMCPEPLDFGIYSFYVNIKSTKQFFEVDAPVNVNYDELVKRCLSI